MAIRDLGALIVEMTGSTDAMRTIANRVCSLHPENAALRASVLDKAWDGIGRWRA